jgi:hypothetical protein
MLLFTFNSLIYSKKEASNVGSKLKLFVSTVSGNWFEHFERFVAQITYLKGFVIA